MEVNLTNPPAEMTIREGNALEPKPIRSIVIDGVLSAPLLFLKGKPSLTDDMITMSIHNATGEIKIDVDVNPHTIHKIKGSLTRDSILNQFKINTDHRYSIQEFLKFIKTMRYYFADKAVHAALIESIQKWSVKVERVITELNDNKGNSNFALETKVNAVEGLVQKFDLLISIFQGYPKMKFTVEIGLDPKNTAVMLYLISDELIELEILAREKAITDVVDQFQDRSFSKVVVS